jgi:hypothetical protein
MDRQRRGRRRDRHPAGTRRWARGISTVGAVAVGHAEQTVSLLTAGFSTADLDSRDLLAVFGGRIRAGSGASVDAGRY